MPAGPSSPFTPGFGKTPPLLVGGDRDRLLEDFTAGLAPGGWAPSRVILMQGLRGMGKTVTLNALEDLARTQGWLVISETATPGFAQRIADNTLPALLQENDPKATKRRVTAVSVDHIGGVESAVTELHNPIPTLRSQMNQLTELLAEHQTGLLFTVDEIHRQSIADMRILTTAIQHAIREDRDVAFVGAGLRPGVAGLLQDEAITFLRRAEQVNLDIVDMVATARALKDPIEAAGRTISDQALDFAVRATQGYPYLIQLIGDSAWSASPDAAQISIQDSERAFDGMLPTLARSVHAPALDPLPDRARAVLLAMAEDDGPSRTGDLAARLGQGTNYLSVYRSRLLNAGVVYSPGHGYLAFALPYLREYLRSENTIDNAARSVARARDAFPEPPTPLGRRRPTES